jgi:hypothetical protein
MAAGSIKKRPVVKMFIMGVVSVALYAALLGNQGAINDHFAKGGWFALLPVLTAFVFSYFHGAFTGHFWTVLGIEASKIKKEVK